MRRGSEESSRPVLRIIIKFYGQILLFSKTACGTPAWPAELCHGEKFGYYWFNILMLTSHSVAVLWLVGIQFIYYIGPIFSPKRALRRVRSYTSSFIFRYRLFSLRSSSSCLRLLLRLLFPSILYCLNCKFWPQIIWFFHCEVISTSFNYTFCFCPKHHEDGHISDRNMTVVTT